MSHVGPAQRLGTVEEVSAAVLYLLSPAASFVTGECIKVDGGGHIQGDYWVIPRHSNCAPFGTLPSKM